MFFVKIMLTIYTWKCYKWKEICKFLSNIYNEGKMWLEWDKRNVTIYPLLILCSTPQIICHLRQVCIFFLLRIYRSSKLLSRQRGDQNRKRACVGCLLARIQNILKWTFNLTDEVVFRYEDVFKNFLPFILMFCYEPYTTVQW